jgi:hypothetical protein
MFSKVGNVCVENFNLKFNFLFNRTFSSLFAPTRVHCTSAHHEVCPRALAAAVLVTATEASALYVPLTDPTAICLDGSRYGFAICPAATNASWTIGIQGGGWCVPGAGLGYFSRRGSNSAIWELREDRFAEWNGVAPGRFLYPAGPDSRIQISYP